MTNYIALVEQASGANEVWSEQKFLVYRGSLELAVTLMDRGPGEIFRYMARAEVTPGRGVEIESTGNPASTPDEALENIHWNEFD
ncbi:hypothetical protein Sked_28820 [Sanguibacter keddieii DSM 10542]|uniref:Uncharacterized protein n=1 Tax=Sanguibacter keddieii (strain ATCC 51767 / DSM 10542 / NCFB 3025 / ST-74) TaxID=446469 RepID=D1BBL3_SANKS|nr:hypothetical protein [Sanguibacter keddieii]ACZ22784.1 hypothetical protein Sked_28820 [Sanguibacter keddieii DSM 10542]